MKRHFIGLTDTGVVRTANQDNYFVDDELGRFFIVADGMGGHAGGQEASKIATEEIRAYLKQYWDSPLSSEVLLKEAVEKANLGIIADQKAHPERGDMGTTVVVLIFREDKPWCAHVGDSRLYRLRSSQLEQITEDHTWVGMALKAGEINPEQAKFHPWRHVLSQCLGRQDLQRIDIQEFEVQPGDRLLICSDGLTEEVPDEKIQAVLTSLESCQATAQELIDTAKAAGGSDNITVVIVAHE
ncbi:Stp1/IreP family PP2C-type Ser/Thr phosphatase [Pleurocapsa sp. PCC 7319]|uniref:Stp1/IreP family PP2C-type Ser/Thr phosphatase n=1 Tax=Pleurocapsa sp. PCC 7319 TaxID=118161 RepID=UPI00034A6928|nr:Stp1/IreP family PP2C-type Ser/Thr phosphatase [Pleurocapsa sp. PCC 7319]